MRRVPLVLVSAALLVALVSCAGTSGWFRGSDPEWIKGRGLKFSGDKVVVVGRSSDRVGSSDAVKDAVQDGKDQLAQAILTRVESQTTQRYTMEPETPLGNRLQSFFESESKSKSFEEIQGIEASDIHTKVLFTDMKGRDRVEAYALVTMPRRQFEDLTRRAGEEIEARMMKDPELVFGMADAAFQDGEEARAQKLLEGILRRNPGDAKSRLFLGQVLEAQGDLDGARKEYEVLCKLDAQGSAGIDAQKRLENLGKGKARRSPPRKAPRAPLKATEDVLAEAPLGRGPAKSGPKSTGSLPETLGDHWQPVLSVAFRRDGKVLASASRKEDGRIRLYSMDDGHPLEEREGCAPVAFSHAGAVLASAGLDGTIEFCDLEENKAWKTRRLGAPRYSAFAFSTDDRQLFTSGLDSRIRRWRVEDGLLLETIDEEDEVTGIAFNALKDVVAVSTQANTVRLLQAGPSKLERMDVFESPDAATCIALSLDGSRLAFGTRDAVYLAGLESGSSLEAIAIHSGWVRSAAFSPNGSILATGSADGKIRLWRPDTQSLLDTIEAHEKDVNCLAFAPGGKILASGGADGVVKVFPMDPAPRGRVAAGAVAKRPAPAGSKKAVGTPRAVAKAGAAPAPSTRAKKPLEAEIEAGAVPAPAPEAARSRQRAAQVPAAAATRTGRTAPVLDEGPGLDPHPDLGDIPGADSDHP